MICISNCKKWFYAGSEQVVVLNEISFTVNEGEFVAIMGVSGSGKSTLLNILGCLDTPSSGVYKFRGQDLASFSARKLAILRNQQIGFIFQSFNLLPKYTVFENIELPLLYTRMNSRQRKSKVLAALDWVGMTHKTHAYPPDLSGGQRQKVAIARAIVGEPSLLLADEPTGNLDKFSTEEILVIFESLNKQGTTIILVTHDPSVAARADRIITLDKGVISTA